MYTYFLFSSNANGSHRKYAQGFKKIKSYCIGIKSTKWTTQVYRKFCERLDTLSNIVANLSSKLDLVELSLVVIKTVNDNILNRIAML